MLEPGLGGTKQPQHHLTDRDLLGEFKILSESAINRRKYWTDELIRLSGSFGDDSAKLVQELKEEAARDGTTAIVDHLRLCGAIPEWYGHDSSEEKLYSKYTDCVLAETFAAIGLNSLVLTARANSADVEAVTEDYSLVADAKAFRLSRTAKNQKDFKVQAMSGWRGAMKHALVVCPIYQLPTRSSQIYQQATASDVAILSYSHLAALVEGTALCGTKFGTEVLRALLEAPALLNPSKDAMAYWNAINRTLLSFEGMADLWQREKMVSLESLRCGQLEALTYLSCERKRLLSLSHADAIKELVKQMGIDARAQAIASLDHGALLEI